MAETHVLSALYRKYAYVMGEVRKAEKQADKHHADLEHLEAVIHLFNPDWTGDGVNATIPVCINHVPEKDIYLGEYEAGVFVIGGSIEYTDIFNGFRSIKFTFSTTDNFWKDNPYDAHECTVLDQGFEAA